VKLPIAETFESIQGEGVWAGTLMHFIRTVGCNVGRYTSPSSEPGVAVKGIDFPLRILREKNPRLSICTSVFGHEFLCDTDYHRESTLDLAEVLKESNARRVCLTGGEPLMFDALAIADIVTAAGKQLHIETSGTKPISDELEEAAYIVCSPKKGFLRENLPRIHEFKFLVWDGMGTPSAVWDRIVEFLERTEAPVFLQPINDTDRANIRNAEFAVKMLVQCPSDIEAALSVQLHKLLGMR